MDSGWVVLIALFLLWVSGEVADSRKRRRKIKELENKQLMEHEAQDRLWHLVNNMPAYCPVCGAEVLWEVEIKKGDPRFQAFCSRDMTCGYETGWFAQPIHAVNKTKEAVDGR